MIDLSKSDILNEIYETCKTDQRKEIINSILYNALSIYQWDYQNSSDYQKNRDSKNGNKLAVDRVLSLLRLKGEDTIADKVSEILGDIGPTTQRQVMQEVSKYFKKRCLETGMSENYYNKFLSNKLKKAFTEFCRENPIENPLIILDSEWEPPYYD